LHTLVKTAEAGSTDRVLNITAHGAEAGDLVRFELSAANPYFESKILSVPDADTIILAAKLPVAISTGDEFFLLRHTTGRVDDTGAIIASVTQGPTQFVLNGSDVEGERDTVTPANSKPLPVINLDNSGVVVDFATSAKQDAQTTLLGEVSANTLVTTLPVKSSGSATNASMIQVGGSDGTNARTLSVDNTGRAKVVVDAYSSGQVDNGSLSLTTAATVTAPANAVGFIVQNESSNANSIRFRVGGTASTSAGVLLEPGRDSGLVPIGANVSLCNTVSSTQDYSVLWVIK